MVSRPVDWHRKAKDWCLDNLSSDKFVETKFYWGNANASLHPSASSFIYRIEYYFENESDAVEFALRWI